MRALSFDEMTLISGGDAEANAVADQAIGSALGKVLHGLTSREARIGAIAGAPGMVVGAIIHFKRHH